MFVEQARTQSRSFGLRVVAGLLMLAGLTAWLTYASIHAYAPNADGATVVLEGSSIIHGQPLLHGWSLSLDSFWSVDALFYALGVATIGVQPILMHLIPALLVALCVLIGYAIASSGGTRRGRVVAAGFMVTALCLPDHTTAFYLLQGPWHVATTLYCLVAVILLARPSFDWRWAIAVVLLALGLTGDFQMIAIGVVPVLIAGLLAMARRRSLRAGLTQVGAAASSCLLALGIRAITTGLGTFTVSESHHTVKMKQLLRDIGHFGNWISALFGTHNGPVVGASIPPYVVIARGVIFVFVVVGVVFALVQSLRGALFSTRDPQHDADRSGIGGVAENTADAELFERSWRVDDLLVCMTIGAIALFGLLTLSNNTSYARYLDPVVIFASILSARVWARIFARYSSNVHRVFAGVLGVVLVVSAISSIQAARERTPAAPTSALARYLGSHHLTHGIGDYWASSIVTVNTDQSIEIRPVVANLQGQIVSDGRQASLGWYAGQRFQFLVYERSPFGRVDAATVRATFGAPKQTVVIGRYFVDTWSGEIALHGRSFP